MTPRTGSTAPVRAPSRTTTVNPRLSARRKAVQSSRRRRRTAVAGILVALVSLGIASWFVLHSSWFSATTVIVRGQDHESSTRISDAAGLGDQPALISISTTEAAQGVERLPWVKHATVSLRWPSTVMISVTERTPVAAVAQGRHLDLIDATGRVLTKPVGLPAGVQVVRLTDQGLTIGPPGSWVPASMLPSVVVAASLPPAFKGQVATVNGFTDGTVTLQLTSPVTVEMGNTAQLTAKFKDIASILAGATLHPGDVIDVSVPQASTITGP